MGAAPITMRQIKLLVVGRSLTLVRLAPGCQFVPFCYCPAHRRHSTRRLSSQMKSPNRTISQSNTTYNL